MTSPPARPVVVAHERFGSMRLSTAPNGSRLTETHIAELCNVVSIPHRDSPRAVWIRTSDFPDFLALCQVRGITVNAAKAGV